MEVILTVISGIAWTIVYAATILIGFRHRTRTAYPADALALNFA